MEGRSRRSVLASFHSLRHTFVSLSANAGVPLPVVQSIVGHCSTAMTRHYYHENEAVLRKAVEAIPAIGTDSETRDEGIQREGRSPLRPPSVASRLKRLSQLLAEGLVSEDEYTAQRTRILNEL